jgi:uncharacterized glyoxalase superfamily protein PhnB
MFMPVKPVPDGYHTVTPYLAVEGVDKLIPFLQRAFGATEIHAMKGPDGKIVHAEMRIGDSIVMLGEARADFGPRPSTIYLYVPNVDAVYQQALEAGATGMTEPANQFYGDRHGSVKDPSDNYWWIATHVEDIPPEEMTRRAEAAMKQQAGK